jgi:hypothetical protein
MTTFAALGDSITLGVGDPAPGGGWRGWATLLAQGMSDGRLVNLAANGARAADVERLQLPRALELRPDVASVIVGINDALRAGFNAARIQAALAHVAGSLSAAGAVVLTMRLPDVLRARPGAAAARGTAGRTALLHHLLPSRRGVRRRALHLRGNPAAPRGRLRGPLPVRVVLHRAGSRPRWPAWPPPFDRPPRHPSRRQQVRAPSRRQPARALATCTPVRFAIE